MITSSMISSTRRYSNKQTNKQMEISPFAYVCLTISFIYLIVYRLSATSKTSHHLPPCPAAALPVLGHLHLIKQPLHRTFQRFSETHGPIFSLKLGFHRAVVVSSPDLVEECFTKNDAVLANRPATLADEYIGYNHTTMSGAPHGDHWRSLRRIGAQELLSTASLNAFLHIRRDEVNRLLLGLHGASGLGFAKVELRPRLSELTFNVMMRMIAGKRYFSTEDAQSEQGKRFRKLISHAFELAEPSPQDFLPFLQWIDHGGYTKKLSSLRKEMDEIFQSLVDEHRLEKSNTMIGHLLSLQESQPESCSDLTIKGLMLSMLFAGTDTSAVTIEWAMSNLINHPNILRKAREELDTKVGLHRLMDEEDLSNLPYLQNIILETFRLFPAAPLLLPHMPSADCRVGGYGIPRGTMLFVNAWAIHRDPELWEDATSFKPERFEGKEVEVTKLMPFGMGRRACPGAGLARRVVGLALGSMIQCFEWERAGLEEVDLAEGVGVTMPKLKPLEVLCKPREKMYKVIQELS